MELLCILQGAPFFVCTTHRHYQDHKHHGHYRVGGELYQWSQCVYSDQCYTPGTLPTSETHVRAPWLLDTHCISFRIIWQPQIPMGVHSSDHETQTLSYLHFMFIGAMRCNPDGTVQHLQRG